MDAVNTYATVCSALLFGMAIGSGITHMLPDRRIHLWLVTALFVMAMFARPFIMALVIPS